MKECCTAPLPSTCSAPDTEEETDLHHQRQAKSYQEFLRSLAVLHGKAMHRLAPQIGTSFSGVFILFHVHLLHLSQEFHLSCTLCTELLQTLRAHLAQSTYLGTCAEETESAKRAAGSRLWSPLHFGQIKKKIKPFIIHNSGL